MGEYLPETVTLNFIITAFVIAAMLALIAAIVLAAIESRFKNYFQSFVKIWLTLTAYSAPIALVAYMAGYLTAFSRVGVIGNVLAAVLALIGGLNIYIFGSDNKYKVLVAYCVSIFAIMLFYGTQSGAYRREADREARMIELMRQEIRIRNMRKNLGLPEEFPSWMISTEPK